MGIYIARAQKFRPADKFTLFKRPCAHDPTGSVLQRGSIGAEGEGNLRYKLPARGGGVLHACYTYVQESSYMHATLRGITFNFEPEIINPGTRGRERRGCATCGNTRLMVARLRFAWYSVRVCVCVWRG